MEEYLYYTLIFTDKKRDRFLLATTGGDLAQKIQEISAAQNCAYLIYIEGFSNARAALIREETLNKWSKKKKRQFINDHNPAWEFLNNQFLETNSNHLF